MQDSSSCTSSLVHATSDNADVDTITVSSFSEDIKSQSTIQQWVEVSSHTDLKSDDKSVEVLPTGFERVWVDLNHDLQVYPGPNFVNILREIKSTHEPPPLDILPPVTYPPLPGTGFYWQGFFLTKLTPQPIPTVVPVLKIDKKSIQRKKTVYKYSPLFLPKAFQFNPNK